MQDKDSDLIDAGFNAAPRDYSPLTLAFIGDGVYDLLVRSYVALNGNRPVGEMNKIKVSLVNCRAQAEFAKNIMPLLSDEETAVYKRGRNAHPASTPKNYSVADYHSATGLEALFGYLYISGNFTRIKELFDSILELK